MPPDVLEDHPLTDAEIDKIRELYEHDRDKFSEMARRLIVTILELREKAQS